MNFYIQRRPTAIPALILLCLLFITIPGSWAQTTLKIVNNFNVNTKNATTYFGANYPDDQVWLYFLNTGGKVTYTDTDGVLKTVTDTHSIKLSKVKSGTFTLAVGANSAKVFAGLGTSDPFSGNNGPGVFDTDVPYALLEWTINGNEYDNADLSYEDSVSFPTTLTVYNASGTQTDQATFQAGTTAQDIINKLQAALPTGPVGPYPQNSDNNYPSSGNVGYGPLVPTVSGNTGANRCIGSSKTWISGPDTNNLRSMYIYAPSLNSYLAYLKTNETSQFNNGISGWFIDYSGNGGYSGYLTITGSDQNYGLRIHDIRVNTAPSAANSWKADPNAGATTTGEITVLANNTSIQFPSDPTTNVTGPWTDGVIYSGAALVGTLGGGPVVAGTGDFADGGTHNDIVATMLASISASIATGLLGSDMYNNKITATTPGSTMYWFNTMTRAQSTQKLFDKAWPGGQKYYDPFWGTMAELTNMQGYLSPFNDRWQNFSPDFALGENYTMTWELGIPAAGAGNYFVSGYITGNVIDGITVSLSGDASKTTTTNSEGFFFFENLANGKYIVTPTTTGYSFSPSHASVTVAGSDQPSEGFTATALLTGTHSVSGTISGDVKEKVIISLSPVDDPNNIITTTTSAEGTYFFPNLVEGDYFVTPYLRGYLFSPSGYTITILNSSKIATDFVAIGAKVAIGSKLLVETEDIAGFDIDQFLVKPRVYTKYALSGRRTGKSNIRVLTRAAEAKGATFLNCIWIDNIRLYDRKELRKARKQGISTATWVANPVNQESLEMELCIGGRKLADLYVYPIALELPEITNISTGWQNEKGDKTLVITGRWFGSDTLKVSREYNRDGAIKLQKMRVLKPTEADADAGYKDHKGKPSFMNCQTGASKVVVVIPSRDPGGALNGTLVLDNGIGIATGTIPLE